MARVATAGRDRPIFILASGWRTGSTLLQRLLCSHPDVRIWGENRGLCDHLARLYRDVLNHQPSAARAEWDLHMKASNAWIANLNPAPSLFLQGIRAFLEDYYAIPAAAMGRARWGFKEVRQEFEMDGFLRLLYPGARFLLLVRHPRDSLASARATQRTWRLLDQLGGPTCFLDHWARTARSFLSARNSAGELLLRYEDVLAGRHDAVVQIGDFLGVDRGGLHSEVLDTTRRGWTDAEPYLTDEDYAALDSPALWEVAREYGYER